MRVPTMSCDAIQATDQRIVGGMRMIVRGAVLLLLFVLPSPLGAQDEKETVFWESVECESAGQVGLYLEVYTGGAYVEEARACLEGQLGLDRSAQVLIQEGLTALDYAPGPADGQFGPATRRALGAWQEAKGFAATGYLTQGQADTLIAQGRDAVAAVQRQQEEADWLAREAAARQAQEADDTAYAEAQQLDTAAAYGDYLAAYPTGRHAAEARIRQQERAETERLTQRPRELRNSIGMEFVLIEAGTFEMGSPTTEPERDDDETLYTVTLSQPFYLGKYEVTQGQWEAVMGDNPSYSSGCGRTCPVEQVSWEDTQEFIALLNQREGAETYRLPTEAEWEYAARAGTQTAYHFGNTASNLESYAWCSYSTLADLFFLETTSSRSVGQKRPSAWILYDMYGNVWEWTADWYGDYPRGAVTDPRGPSTSAGRVIRGGSWLDTAHDCRAANRGWHSPASHYIALGFRLARTP